MLLHQSLETSLVQTRTSVAFGYVGRWGELSSGSLGIPRISMTIEASNVDNAEAQCSKNNGCQAAEFLQNIMQVHALQKHTITRTNEREQDIAGRKTRFYRWPRWVAEKPRPNVIGL